MHRSSAGDASSVFRPIVTKGNRFHLLWVKQYPTLEDYSSSGIGVVAEESLARPLYNQIRSDDIHNMVGAQQQCAGQISASEAMQGVCVVEDHEGTEFPTMSHFEDCYQWHGQHN